MVEGLKHGTEISMRRMLLDLLLERGVSRVIEGFG